MAVTGLDSFFSSIQQCNHYSGFVLMDRQSIDLNKHAIDLNEVPVNDFNVDVYDTSAAHGVGSSLLPKKGGWLELFRNMFGHDNAALDGFLFGSCASSGNSVSLANGKTHRDPRIFSTLDGHIGSSMDQNLDMAQQGFVTKLYSPFQHEKQKRTSKLPICEEDNHGDNISARPSAEHVIMSGRPSHNAASGECGSGKQFLSSGRSPHKLLNCGRGTVQRPLDVAGHHPYSNGLHDPFNLVLGQASMGSSISPNLNHSRPPSPSWDLNSQPAESSWSPDLQRVGLSKSGSHQFSQHPRKHSFSAEAQMMQSVGGSCVLPINSRQDGGFSEREEVSQASSPSKKDVLCLQKKNSRWRYRAKVSESNNDGMLPFVGGKGSNQRIRIIESPDWLPAGWITELKTRMAGSTAGTTDKYYKDPVTGRRFRSKNEVLSFLRLGHICRHKPQARLLAGLANVNSMPLLPLQEQTVGLRDGFQAVATKQTFLTPAMDLSSQASICHSIYLPDLLGDRIPVKQEPEDMTQGGLESCRDNRVADARVLAESSACNPWERCELVVPEIEMRDPPISTDLPPIRTDLPVRNDSTSRCPFHEPVHPNKRKSLDDRFSRLPFKFLRSKAEGPRNQDKWIFRMSPSQREAEAPAASSKVEPMVDTERVLPGYPGLLHKEETVEAQDTVVSEYLTARYRANGKAPALAIGPLISSAAQVKEGCGKELHPASGSLPKGGEKKAPKLTLKQERDLFVTLGRKLCREFLAPAKEPCPQQAEKPS